MKNHSDMTDAALSQADAEMRDAPAGFAQLMAIMRRLRGPDGCEWDRAQTFASIAPYTIEEAYEVAEAIACNDMENLCEELGDLLLQVVFHAAIARDAGHFNLTDVIEAISSKMIRRHPHVFAPKTDSDEAKTADWETIKASEKPRGSALDDVPHALPALMRAKKLGQRAARTGFDWPDEQGPLAKIHEELAEIAAAGTRAERQQEAGDLLFAVVNYLRKLGIDAETALRDGNRKFEARFRQIESTSGFAGMSLSEKENLWQKAKISEAGSRS